MREMHKSVLVPGDLQSGGYPPLAIRPSLPSLTQEPITRAVDFDRMNVNFLVFTESQNHSSEQNLRFPR